MTNVAAALHTFFGSFGIPDYLEGAVPDDATFPYITHQIVRPEWRGSAPFYARVWYRSLSVSGLCAKVDEIAAAIGEGVSIPTNSGAVYITKDAVFDQYMPFEGDDMLKTAYLSMIIQTPTI